MTHFSRAQWSARASRGGPGPLDPNQVEGLAFHWPAMSKPLTTIAAVKAALRGWQNYHMDDKGWSDIGYQAAIDQDGNRYDLRGLHIQSGANGDTDVNERFGAVLLILAPGEKPSAAMLAEIRAVVTDHRALFPRSHRLVGHTDIRPEPTACPGLAALAALRAGDFEPQEDDMFTNEDREVLNRIERMTRNKLERVNKRLARANALLREQSVDLDAVRAELDAAAAEGSDSE